ncbi:Zn-ribbon domain-containing OB-fold protein [Streptomyces brasiliensis]|uniref:Zn-ribbon domain-containing OB-fold protein n=1 Tax=Streptomyces brasiliensis TaxID=1954 RepID=UPI0016715E31|nr:hypothetical protein [Streptomyces brasiliensis]
MTPDASKGSLQPEHQSAEALYFQRCTWCGTTMYNRVLCPACQGVDLRTERSAGTGTVRHSRVVHRNTPVTRNSSLVEMTEGFIVRGRVLGLPWGVRNGQRVRLFTAKDLIRQEPVFAALEDDV